MILKITMSCQPNITSDTGLATHCKISFKSNNANMTEILNINFPANDRSL